MIFAGAVQSDLHVTKCRKEAENISGTDGIQACASQVLIETMKRLPYLAGAVVPLVFVVLLERVGSLVWCRPLVNSSLGLRKSHRVSKTSRKAYLYSSRKKGQTKNMRMSEKETII